MKRLPNLAIRILAALACAALTLAPATAFASVPADDGMTAAHAANDMPCSAPCEDCGDDDTGQSCFAACMGLTLGVPTIAGEFAPTLSALRVTIPAPVSLHGMHREPDTPPPKTFLA